MKINFKMHRIAGWFTNPIELKHHELTDRQKWAFAWIPSSGCVVAIGCSSGSLIKYLNEKSQIVCGIDTEFKTLESIISINPKINLIQASAEKIPLPAEYADTVLLIDVLEHSSDDKMVISEAWRILKSNGQLILSVPHKGLYGFLNRRNVSRKYKNIDEPIHRHCSFTDLRRLFFRLFEVEQKHYGGLFLYPFTVGANYFLKKHFNININNFLNKIGNIDYDVSWGRMSSNIIVKARKI